MDLPHHIAKHFREVFIGSNWTGSSFKEQLENVNLQQATQKVHSFNSIAVLVHHIGYYVSIALKVLQGGKLVGKDELSFDHPPILSEAEWRVMLHKVLAEAEQLAHLIESLPEAKLWEPFTDEKYGNYYRNLHGIIEHTHYHVGQIALLKKFIQPREEGKSEG